MLLFVKLIMVDFQDFLKERFNCSIAKVQYSTKFLSSSCHFDRVTSKNNGFKTFKVNLKNLFQKPSLLELLSY